MGAGVAGAILTAIGLDLLALKLFGTSRGFPLPPHPKKRRRVFAGGQQQPSNADDGRHPDAF